jgi:hypothetical protein
MGLESAVLEPGADPGKRKVPDVESRPADHRGAPANTVSARGDWRSSGRPCLINALDAGELSPSTCRGSTCWCRSALTSLLRALASPHQTDDHTSACKRWRFAVSAFLLFGPARRTRRGAHVVPRGLDAAVGTLEVQEAGLGNAPAASAVEGLGPRRRSVWLGDLDAIEAGAGFGFLPAS